jgi:hypothetical protein
MTRRGKGNLELAVKIVAVLGFLLSLWNFFSPVIRSVSLDIVPERQVQLMQEGNIFAFNLLTTITASGPAEKWQTIKYEEAKLKVPDGRIVTFGCRAYLAEEGLGQKNQSRNIPIALQGGDSRILTAAFQATDLDKWSLGTYEVTLIASTGSGKTVRVSGLKFTLVQNDLNIIAKPNAMYMKVLD